MEDKYSELIRKKRAGTLTDEDRASIKEIMQDPEKKEALAFQVLLQLTLEEKRSEQDESIREMLADRRDIDEKKANTGDPEFKVKKGKRINWNRLFWLAGLLVLIGIISWWFISDQGDESDPPPTITTTKVEQVLALIPKDPGIFSAGFFPQAGGMSQEENIDSLFYQACLELFKQLDIDYSQILECLEKIKVSHFSTADQAAPSDSSLYFYQGWFYLKRGNNGDIQEAYQAFSNAKPDETAARVSEEDITFHKWVSLLLLYQQTNEKSPDTEEELSAMKSEIRSEDYQVRVNRILDILSE
ncbi:MAG: hypothetical protein MI974_20870 [Chitinophagales bacterium]|nr:hypothetical protein [Chitinophagales bacterium]